jgi:hypothetical protein
MRLSRTHELWVYGASLSLWLTGGLWLLFHYYVSVETPFGAQPHPLESWCLSMHGAAAMVALVVLGTLLPVHVWRSWSARRNRASGVGLLATAALLMGSGWSLYYGGNADLRFWVSLGHWSLGLLSMAVLAGHVVLGRRSMPRSNRAKPRHEQPRLRATASEPRISEVARVGLPPAAVSLAEPSQDH